MSFRSWFAALQDARTFDRLQREWRRSPCRRRASRFYFPAEVLEVRSLLSAYTAASVSALIADINAANKNGGTNTITLAANTTFDLTAVNNTTNGANGLPVIGAKTAVNLTIIGNGDTIERSAAAGTPAFRLFDVASGSSLTLESVTLQNGVAQGPGAAADGGAIYNQGSLTLIGATVQNNAAEGNNGANGLVTQKQTQSSAINGQAGGDAAGGAIWSSGSVTLEGGSVLQQNQALGGQGGAGGVLLGTSFGNVVGNGGAGGGGFGGGLYEAGGSANITDATLSDNTAAGGAGGNLYQVFTSIADVPASAGLGGRGAGGGLYAAGGMLNVSGVIVEANWALGGTGGGFAYFSITVSGNGGAAYGGGIEVAGGTATLAMTELLSNEALGGTGGYGGNDGFGGNGGNGSGGGLYAGGGALTLTNDTVTGNDASGGIAGADNMGSIGGGNLPFPTAGAESGGGLEIASAATLSLDSFTLNNTNNNTIGLGGIPFAISNIDGTYILLP